ncbi:MAG: monooxygenase [Deltaproteobacteria bacterium]|nr:monooxygenase [Deltaproteobacteria bacterium]
MLIVALGACRTEPGPNEPTYYGQVRPILAARCAACHSDGGIAPFALTSYEAVYARRTEIRRALDRRTMPPWPPAPDCNEYANDRALKPDERDLLAAWLSAGAPAGDPADEASPVEGGGGDRQSFDLVLAMPESYTPRLSPDDYRCFLIDWPERTPTYVTGLSITPGQTSIVHHVIVYLAQPEHAAEYAALDAADPGPGYTCFGGPVGTRGGGLGGWVPGSLGHAYPDGTGIAVRPGTKVVLQVHYNTPAVSAKPDRTAVSFSRASTVLREAVFLPWSDPAWLEPGGMPIPAGAKQVVHTFAADPTLYFAATGVPLPFAAGEPVRIHGVAHHQHVLGTRGRIALRRAQGAEECLLSIPQWDFHWQGEYFLTTPTVALPGDQLGLECQWDNSAENQPVVDGVRQPPRDVEWGDGTTDEMCVAFFYVTGV